MHADNNRAGDIWSNGTILWVTDYDDNKLYAYRMSDGSHLPGRDIALDAANTDPEGVWSDGTTMWVSDDGDEKVYAYTLTNNGANRNARRDFNLAPGHLSVRDLWSDGRTMWAVDVRDEKLYAYTLTSTGATYEPVLDLPLFAGLEARGIWSDGDVMWVADHSPTAIHEYDLPRHDNPGSVTVWYAEPPTVGSLIFVFLHDSDVPFGWSWEWARSSNKSSGFTDIASASGDGYTPTSADEGKYLRATVTYDDNEGTGKTAEWVSGCPVPASLEVPEARRSFRLHCDNDYSVGLWGDDTTLWVADFTNKVYAYNRSDLSYDSAKNFALHADNDHAGDLWSNGTILWVTDNVDDKLYAYRLSDGSHQPTRDIALDAANGYAEGVWSDGTTMWVSDDGSNKVYAYTLTNNGANRNARKDFNLAPGNVSPKDLWSDGTILWVVDLDGDKLYAYRLNNSGATYEPALDLSLPASFGTRGIWSDGEVMWVADHNPSAVHDFDMPDIPGAVTVWFADPPTVGSGMISMLHDPDGPFGWSWQWARSSDKESGFTDIGDGTNGYTPTSADEGMYLRATVTYDDNEGTGNTAEWVSDCPVAAPLALSGARRSFRLYCENDFSVGLWGDDTTLWVSDLTDQKVYAYHINNLRRDRDKDFALHADNDRAGDMWSNGTILWVTDYDDNKLYAYRMSDGSHQPTRDIALDAANTNPEGVWSDGTTMWVSDSGDEKVYAYTLTRVGANRNATRDFNLAPGNLSVRDLWSDGTTMWAVDVRDEKLYAYRLNNSGATYEPTQDLPLFAGLEARGIWSDGDVMWVADYSPASVHDYRLPRYDSPGGISVSRSDVPTVGSAIHAVLLDPDVPVTGLAWQWARSSNKSSGVTNIAGLGARGNGYTPTSADVGKYLRATATYNDAGGTGRIVEWVCGLSGVGAVGAIGGQEELPSLL